MPTKPVRHVDNFRIDGRLLGRRPHDPSRLTLHLSRLLTGVVPDHPATVDHFAQIPPSRWGVLGNDRYSDCGPADIVHDRMLVAKYLGNQDIYPNTADALDLYKRSGNPSFPAEDNGVVIADMLDVVHKQGVRNGSSYTQCVAYAQVNTQDLDEVHAAIAIFGSLSCGADLHAAQNDQTNNGEPWDYVANSPDWGGHAFLVGRYNSDTRAGRPDLGGLTWGFPVGITDEFWVQQVQEAWVVIWPEHLTNRSFLTGVDQTALSRDYKQLTDRDLPVLPAPTPTPVPVPAPGGQIITPAQLAANQQLATMAHSWLRYSHTGTNGQLAQTLDAWVKAWGL